MQKLLIEAFLEQTAYREVLLSEQPAKYCLFDVRSPSEYAQGHIPGALSLPLFTDEERKIVGTAYKQQSREVAIKIGLDFFGPKMRPFVEQVENHIAQLAKDKNSASQARIPVYMYCWRGGMRSGAMAWLLELYGFQVFTLQGGYKAFRNWALAQFNKPYPLCVLGGYTGSGKTELLSHLTSMGYPMVDLEHLACHKGSAFGGYDGTQPSQEHFENRLAVALTHGLIAGKPIWIEDESRRIGKLNIPEPLWHTLRTARLYFLDIPFEHRLAYIEQQYGHYPTDWLIDAVNRIQKKLGGKEAQTAVQYLKDNNIIAAFAILLRYYDKLYKKGFEDRLSLGGKVQHIPCPSVNNNENVSLLIEAEENKIINKAISAFTNIFTNKNT